MSVGQPRVVVRLHADAFTRACCWDPPPPPNSSATHSSPLVVPAGAPRSRSARTRACTTGRRSPLISASTRPRGRGVEASLRGGAIPYRQPGSVAVLALAPTRAGPENEPVCRFDTLSFAVPHPPRRLVLVDPEHQPLGSGTSYRCRRPVRRRPPREVVVHPPLLAHHRPCRIAPRTPARGRSRSSASSSGTVAAPPSRRPAASDRRRGTRRAPSSWT